MTSFIYIIAPAVPRAPSKQDALTDRLGVEGFFAVKATRHAFHYALIQAAAQRVLLHLCAPCAGTKVAKELH